MDKATYHRLLKELEDKISGMERGDFIIQFAAECKSPSLALVLSLLFGQFGIDRLYLGHYGLALLKLISFGGLGFWTVIDWFIIMSETRKKNLEIAENMRLFEDYGVL